MKTTSRSIAAILCASPLAFAAEPTLHSQAQEIDRLEQQVNELKAKQAVPVEPIADNKGEVAPDHPVVVIDILNDGQIRVQEWKGKTEIRIYDYVEPENRLTAHMFRKRTGAFRTMGYEVMESCG